MSDPIVATLVVSSTLVYFMLVGVTFALMPKHHKDTGTVHIGAFLDVLNNLLEDRYSAPTAPPRKRARR